MKRKLFSVATLAAGAVSTLMVVGCESNKANPPYGLTGPSQEQIDQQHQQWLLDRRFTDDKGHYRPEMANWNKPIY